MNTYINISLITVIVGIMVEKNGMSEQEAINAFYLSKIYRKLNEKNSLLKQMSPYFIYELWDTERNTGDYRQSSYINALL